MSQDREVTRVPVNVISELKKIVQQRRYKRDADIIYKGHVPHCGFLLLEGEITLRLSKTKILTLNKCSLIGIRELMNAEPFKFDAYIKSDSKVYILDRSTVNELLKSENEKLKALFFDEVG